MSPGQDDGRLGPLPDRGRLPSTLVHRGGKEQGQGLAEGMGQLLGQCNRRSAHLDRAVRQSEQSQGPGAEVEGAGTRIVVPIERCEQAMQLGLVLRNPPRRIVEGSTKLSAREQRHPEGVMRLQH